MTCMGWNHGRNRIGTKLLEQCWNRVGTGLEHGWNSVGTGLEQGWNRVGTKLKQVGSMGTGLLVPGTDPDGSGGSMGA